MFLLIGCIIMFCSILLYFTKLPFRPNSKAGMLQLEDFPEAKVEKFGGDFVKVILKFCEEHSLKMNNFPEDEIIKVFTLLHKHISECC